ncbi:hypothetical protein F8R89_17145 [Streptomyces sp. SS1-1]|uniref:DUF6529 family protein n=1 Tax=Streptomyces sp. SS1-1 TaxID=2651869 RepID=UPI001250A789|nr:DUF6529 family protein [Streptomyces sp. SS1-1]KAB2973580.1 hypothetical protein F8R89_17145 [Streptomyces sp. SS1-1]
MEQQPDTSRGTTGRGRAAVLLLIPVAVGLGIWFVGRGVTPDPNSGLFGARYDDAMEFKARLGSALLGLALVQLLLAAWMYGVLPGSRPAPRAVPLAHRVTGLLAFLLSVPIAYHCLSAYGIETTSPRVAIHSVTGCVLYGAFAAKVVVVRSRRFPGWTLPLGGGLLFCAIALLWYTAALWQLNGFDSPGLT